MKYLLFYMFKHVYTVFMFPSLINSIWNFCITIFSLSWVELNKNKSNYLFQERGGAKLPEWNTDEILNFRAIFSIYSLTIYKNYLNCLSLPVFLANATPRVHNTMGFIKKCQQIWSSCLACYTFRIDARQKT